MLARLTSDTYTVASTRREGRAQADQVARQEPLVAQVVDAVSDVHARARTRGRPCPSQRGAPVA